jgi:hypothetical protein
LLIFVLLIFSWALTYFWIVKNIDISQQNKNDKRQLFTTSKSIIEFCSATQIFIWNLHIMWQISVKERVKSHLLIGNILIILFLIRLSISDDSNYLSIWLYLCTIRCIFNCKLCLPMNSKCICYRNKWALLSCWESEQMHINARLGKEREEERRESRFCLRFCYESVDCYLVFVYQREYTV